MNAPLYLKCINLQSSKSSIQYLFHPVVGSWYLSLFEVHTEWHWTFLFRLYLIMRFKRQWMIFFWTIFGGHQSFSWSHWYSCFGLRVTSVMGFKDRVDPLLACFLACIEMDSSDSPLVRHLLTSWRPALHSSFFDRHNKCALIHQHSDNFGRLFHAYAANCTLDAV